MTVIRKVNKPQRRSRSIETLKKKAALEDWKAMLTFKPPDSDSVEKSNSYHRYLTGLLRREFKKMSVGFCLVREFGSGKSVGDRPDCSHFHVVVNRTLDASTRERIKCAFLRRCGLENNITKAFHYTEHEREGPQQFGAYISKIEKGSKDVHHPPQGWDLKKLIRSYHYSGIGQNS